MAEIQKPSLSVTNVRVTDFKFDEIELTFDVAVDNPNPIDLQLNSYSYDFNINQNTFVEGVQQEGLRIEAAGQSIIQIPVQVNFQELYALFNSLKGQDEVGYEMLADLTFNLPVLGATTLPLKKEGNIPLLKLPEITVSGLEVQNLTFSEVDLALHLRLRNPNGFGLILNALSYNLRVNGKTWVESVFTEKIVAEENEATQITIPLSFDMINIGTSVTQLLKKSEDLTYSLKGSLDVGTNHPLLDNTIFNFLESGGLPVVMQ